MTLAEQLATLLEQGGDKPRHRVVAAEELRRLRAEVDQLRAELTALREAASAIVDRDFTFFSGEMIGASRKITRAEVLALRAASASKPGATK